MTGLRVLCSGTSLSISSLPPLSQEQVHPLSSSASLYSLSLLLPPTLDTPTSSSQWPPIHVDPPKGLLLMEEEEGVYNSEHGRASTGQPQEEKEEEGGEHNVVKFLDSVDSYLTLFESLSSILRQGWMDLAGARHSMGVSRVNSSLFDLKYHHAATSLQVTECNVDSTIKQPVFTLCKWASPDYQKYNSEEAKFDTNELQKKSTNPQLRYRGTSEIQEKRPDSNGSILTVDSQIQRERSKMLSMFGTLVSPKLRATQLSFESALDTLVQIANMRSSMLAAYDQVLKEMGTP